MTQAIYLAVTFVLGGIVFYVIGLDQGAKKILVVLGQVFANARQGDRVSIHLTTEPLGHELVPCILVRAISRQCVVLAPNDVGHDLYLALRSPLTGRWLEVRGWRAPIQRVEKGATAGFGPNTVIVDL